MSDQGIFIFAVVVFTLMVVGLVLTILEFRASAAEMQSVPVRAEGPATHGK